MSASFTSHWCSLPENARRFKTWKDAERGMVEWALTFPVVLGNVQIVNINGVAFE